MNMCDLRRLCRWAGLVLLLAAGQMTAGHANEAENARVVRLVGYTHAPSLSVATDAQEASWLARNRGLTVGVVPNNLVPFDLVSLENEYEGISADYLQLLATALNLEIKVKTFSTIEEATAALDQGQIDILPTVRAQAGNRSALSTLYFPSRYVEVSVLGREFDRSAEISVGYVPGHVSLDALRKAYPRGRLVPCGSVFLGGKDGPYARYELL